MSRLSRLVPNTRMGPEHSAIVLSDDSQPNPRPPAGTEVPAESGSSADMVVDVVNPEVPQVANAPTPPETTPRMPEETILRRFQELAGRDRSTTALPDLASYSEETNPSYTPRFPPLPSTSMMRPSTLRVNDSDTLYFNVYSRRSGPSSTEAATTLGQRVEARAAAGRSASHNAEETANRITELRTSIDSYISRLNRHGEELLAAASSLRQEPRQSSARRMPRISTTATAAAASSDPIVSGANRRLLTATQLQEEFDRVTSRAQEDLRDSEQRWRSLETRPLESRSRFSLIDWDALPNSAEEFGSYLSSLQESLRNQRSSESESAAEPPASREPLPWPMDLASDSDDDDELDWLLSAPERRRRRIQPPAGGLESERARSDMLGRARAALMTSRTSSQETSTGFDMSSIPLTASSAITDPTRTRRRRRGWGTSGSLSQRRTGETDLPITVARLDRDGNEIPTDEEEEYERNRAHMRARAQALSSGNGAEATSTESLTVPPPPPSHQRHSYMFNATTRNEMSAPQEPAAIRVRLSSRNREGAESLVSREQRTRFRARAPSQTTLRRRSDTLIVPVRVPSPSPSSTPVIFQASPLPWSTPELVPTVSRIKERRMSGRVRASMKPPVAGR
ncbi:hypothetical protein EIP86_009818 [Pleurotus ostreatoroseus]|nr:hypothetical protein EIP86_009818 [Pleurotus ostreatoroseus]